MIGFLFYRVKPFIPRRVQLFLRRRRVRRLRSIYSSVWPIDPTGGKRPVQFSEWPGDKKFALVLTHDVETQRGHDRCEALMRLEKRLGFVSSFNFVPERYPVSHYLRALLRENGFEIGLHGLRHDGRLFSSRAVFLERARRINQYLKAWNACGFRSPAMIRNLDWISDLAIEYDSSTFDTDPFEPQPEGTGTIFPYIVKGEKRSFVELPYTLPQDFTLFVLLKESTPVLWLEKIQWVAAHGGMVLLNTHPDYMNFSSQPCRFDEYQEFLYRKFLEEVSVRYAGSFWHALPREVARFWRSTCMGSPIVSRVNHQPVHLSRTFS